VYSIAEAGCEALLSWVDSPPVERQVRDEQLVKVLCYGFLPVSNFPYGWRLAPVFMAPSAARLR
jgi:hypothetical protein